MNVMQRRFRGKFILSLFGALLFFVCSAYAQKQTSNSTASGAEAWVQTFDDEIGDGGIVFFAIVHSFFRSAGMYGINPLLKAISCTSLGAWRTSTMKPLT